LGPTGIVVNVFSWRSDQVEFAARLQNSGWAGNRDHPMASHIRGQQLSNEKTITPAAAIETIQ